MAARKLVISLIAVFSLVVMTCTAQYQKAGDPKVPDKETDGTTVQSKVNIDNILDACIKIEPKKSFESNGLLMLATSWENKTNIGECGCKSAAMHYRVKNLNDSGYKEEVLETEISSRGKKEFNFILNADTDIKFNNHYEIEISCQD